MLALVCKHDVDTV